MVESSLVGLSIGISIIFTILLISICFIAYPRQDLLQTMGGFSFTVITLILIQFVYLFLHTTEKLTKNSKYLFISYIFMMFMGAILFFMFMVDTYFRNIHIFAESVILLGAGITLFLVQLKKEKNGDNL